MRPEDTQPDPDLQQASNSRNLNTASPPPALNFLIANLLTSGDADPGKPAWYRRPVMLISLLAFSILAVEALSLLLLRKLPHLSHHPSALGDGLVLLTGLPPALFLLVIRPMVRLVDRTELVERESRQRHRFLAEILKSMTYPFAVIKPTDYTITRADPAAENSSVAGSHGFNFLHGPDSPCEFHGVSWSNDQVKT